MPATDSRSTSSIQVANAPCSWGSLEFEDISDDEEIGYQQMLDELLETGYVGTELGDWSYMPTGPETLRAELEQRDLTMVGAFVPVALRDESAHEDGEERALRVARLMAEVSDDHRPFVVLADDNGSDPVRTQHAGRVTHEMGLSRAEWKVFASGATRIARAVRDETGLPTAFHHHCAGYVETPDEIEHFLALTDPNLIGLVLDTGHYAYGSIGCQALDEVFDRFGARIKHVHFKDLDPKVARRARDEEWGYFEAVRHGVFCELGRGCVDFPSVVDELRGHGYEGWIVVEQDVLPGMGTPRASAQRNRNYLRDIGL
jgi:inosose dehydratase